MEFMVSRWCQTFGPPGSSVSDQEGGLASDIAADVMAHWETQRVLRPRNQHVPLIERHNELLRQGTNKAIDQATTGGLTVSVAQCNAEATFAKNSLFSLDGATPYVAVFGRQPGLLRSLDDDVVALDAADPLGNHQRLREIALTSMIQATAMARLQRAEASKSRMAGELKALEVGGLCEFYRQPITKDSSGWRGPATVVDLSKVGNSEIVVRW